MSKKNETERTLAIGSNIRALDTAMKAAMISRSNIHIITHLSVTQRIMDDILVLVDDTGTGRLESLGLLRELRSSTVKLYTMLAPLYEYANENEDVELVMTLCKTSDIVYCGMKQFHEVYVERR